MTAQLLAAAILTIVLQPAQATTVNEQPPSTVGFLRQSSWNTPAGSQSVSFDFDNAPAHSPLPIDVTVGGLTAHLSATGQGFSIQPANAMGFTPAGFAGNCVYPSSINLADLLVGFSATLTDFSIMYAPQELGCDDTARMRVTAYMNGVQVGTNTATAPFPGTWPTETLAITVAGGFNSVVVHYDARPPTCQDWGPIFLADNMMVTQMCVAASIGGQPTGMATCPAGAANFAVTATGSGTVSYQWQRETTPASSNFVDLADGPTASWDGGAPGIGGIVTGSSSATLTIAADTAGGKVLAAVHAIRYRCTATNSCGSAASNPAQLTLDGAPVITFQPTPVAVCVSGAADFFIDVTGTGTVRHRWQAELDPGVWTDLADGNLIHNSIVIGSVFGAASSWMTVSALANFNLDRSVLALRCVATDDCTSVTSAPAALTVLNPLPGDVNGDHVVDGNDIQPFVRIIDVGWTPGAEFCAADMNGSGRVDALDVPLFVAKLLGP